MRSWTNATVSSGLGDVVHPRQTDLVLHRDRLPVTSNALAEYVDWFWTVSWSRFGAPLRSSEVIPNPVCHLTFETGRRADGRPSVRHGVTMPAAVVTTVWTGRFVVQLAGEGLAFGLRFRPGGLAALVGRELPPDRTLPVGDLLPEVAELLGPVLAEPDDHGRRDLVESRLTPRLPPPGQDFVLARDLVEWAVADSAVVRVEQVAERAGLSVRAVQRLFRTFIGIGPKWVLMRARLKDAVAALDSDPDTDLAELAIRFGWYDQPHFARDFRHSLGVTPGRYARDARQEH